MPGADAPSGEALDASIIVALGGNLGGEATIEGGLASLSGEGVVVVARSRLWRSAAWPDPADPPFLNAVARVQTDLPPQALLAALHRVEAGWGRRRGQPNAPRTLDLDLIAYGRLTAGGEGVELPHPRAAERLFVMGPLAEIAPGWRHPLTGETAQALAGRATIGCDARPLQAP